MIKKVRKSFIAGVVLAAGLAFSVSGYADMKHKIIQPLSGVDTMLTTIVSKSKIAGTLEKDAYGNLALDANGNFKFNFSGDIYYPVTNPLNGELVATSGPLGTVAGQVAFPQSFAGLAFSVYGWLMNGADPSQMPAIPDVIRWSMNEITIVDAGTTYVPIPNKPEMALEGRAFTGLGPVEIGQLLNGSNGLSMSVRMGGCFAVQGVSGPHAGKIGTYCLNSTFTFDLSGINLANPMQSTLNGTGTSNCFTVLHNPIM
ncbi:MAG: hypothetical protein AB1560_02415 [Pseudomonadota bacterium]